ncbi:glycosyltransferase family 4 protein [Thermodesulfobacteriota bacterium]
MGNTIRIYQSFYEDSQVPELDRAFTPYDVRESPFPDLYETYWLMQIYDSEKYKKIEYCSLVSWKFNQKTGITGDKFLEFIDSNPGFDVYFINPYPFLAYRFFNVWEHGRHVHKGIASLAQRLLDEVSCKISVSDMGRNARDTLLYCNFWVGNKKFWDAYIGFIRPLYDYCVHKQSPGGTNPFFTATTHNGQKVPFFTFIFERLFSTFIISEKGIAACPYRHTAEEILNSCTHPWDREFVERLRSTIDDMDSRMQRSDPVLHRTEFHKIIREDRQRYNLEWFFKPAMTPDGNPSFLSNIMCLAWVMRVDLQETFDIHTEEGLVLYYLWWLRHGRKEYKRIPFDADERLGDYLEGPSDSVVQDGSDLIIRRLYLLWCLNDKLKKQYDLKIQKDRQRIIDWWGQKGRYETNIFSSLETLYAPEEVDSRKDPSVNTEKRPSIEQVTQDSIGTYKDGGVNIVGFALGELGIGEDVRTAAQAMTIQDVPFKIYNAPLAIESRADDHREKGHIARAPVYKTNIIFLPAIETLRLILYGGSGIFKGRYTIGAWQWELPAFPSELRAAYRLVDEIWAASRYTARAFQESSPVEVRRMRPAVEIETVPKGSRRSFGLPEEPFLFLFIFDSLSGFERKNPMACIEAFKRAFPQNNKEVGLVVKCMNARPEHKPWRLMMEACKQDDRIISINEIFSREQTLGLLNCCDALVSLHRAEGFGRTIAEAMLLGKPVVVTNHSGNTDFTNEDTAFLVEGSMVPLQEGDYLYGTGQFWCDPDVDCAASQLKRCFEDRKLASEIADAGQAFVREEYNKSVVGKDYRNRLIELGIIS